jgi:hypothetical protein
MKRVERTWHVKVHDPEPGIRIDFHNGLPMHVLVGRRHGARQVLRTCYLDDMWRRGIDLVVAAMLVEDDFC